MMGEEKDTEHKRKRKGGRKSRRREKLSVILSEEWVRRVTCQLSGADRKRVSVCAKKRTKKQQNGAKRLLPQLQIIKTRPERAAACCASSDACVSSVCAKLSLRRQNNLH